jgi:phosphonate transport system substrate-binding protein
MKRSILGSIVLAAGTLFGLAAFQNPAPSQDPPKPAPTPAPAPKPDDPDGRRPMDASIRFSFVPDSDKEKLEKKYEILTKFLAKELVPRKIELVPFADYAAAAAGLAANKVDVAWLNGVSALQAEEASKQKCWPLFTREEELKAKSYFIATKKLVDAGTFKAIAERNPMPLEQLAALKPKFAELCFSFGEKSSGPDHLMPRYFLEQTAVGIDPEKSFKQKPSYASGVLANVASGACDLGVVSSSVWEQAKDEQKAQAPVIFVTPEYLDYSMVVHTRNGPALPLRLQGAFVRLNPQVEEQKAVLELFGAKRFTVAGSANLAALREITKSAKERKLLE